MFLRTLTLLAATSLAASCSTAHVPPPAPAVGGLAHVEVIDRTNGERLPVYWHQGKRWIAGTPGHRYTIAIRNRSGGRLLTVIAVDGVNAVSGETAAWNQTGYVFEPGRSAEIKGWRKSTERVAAFEFTALENSYAARTGRPDNVGVIGVAVFREAVREVLQLAPPAKSRSDAAAEDTAPAPRSESAQGALAGRANEAREALRPGARLGTGHGRSETSRVTHTDFVRAADTPDEVITIHYDSRENLLAMGVLPRSHPVPPGEPNPFPDSQFGFVPDPPR
jgi:hypothetical protein